MPCQFIPFLLIFHVFIRFHTFSQDSVSSQKSTFSAHNFSAKGYMQVRYNDLYNSNTSVPWSEGDGFVLKTLAIAVSGKIYDRLFLFIQPDFATAIGESKHVVRLSDAYGDLYIDKNAVLRLRIGQSRVPFGYQHLQSSKHRLSLEASEAFANTWSNGRDMGLQLLWTPKQHKLLFKEIASMKGTGDYGMLALGMLNGRRANTPENNKNKHVVARFCYPFRLLNQYLEISMQAYAGKIRLSNTSLSAGVKSNPKKQYNDQRIAASASLYANPIGVRAEYTIGHGPAFTPGNDSIEQTTLNGGYVLLNARIPINKQQLFPFVQYHHYQGGRPYVRDAQHIDLQEWEGGCEWHVNAHLEVTLLYGTRKWTSKDFASKNARSNRQSLRVQTQINF